MFFFDDTFFENKKLVIKLLTCDSAILSLQCYLFMC